MTEKYQNADLQTILIRARARQVIRVIENSIHSGRTFDMTSLWHKGYRLGQHYPLCASNPFDDAKSLNAHNLDDESFQSLAQGFDMGSYREDGVHIPAKDPSKAQAWSN